VVLQNVVVTISQLDSGGPYGVTADCSAGVSLEEKSVTTTSNKTTGEQDADVTSLAACSSSSTTADALALIQQLSPLPKSNTVRKRARKVEGAEVVTGSPYKQRAMEKALKKTTKSSGQNKKKAEKKKKLKCRLDKPRGRKPRDTERRPVTPTQRTKAAEVGKRRVMKMKRSSVGEGPAKRPKKSEVNQNRKVTESTDNETPCIYCNEKFGDSVSGEQWIQCCICSGWCHVDCSSGETSRGFVCDFCY